MESDAQLQEIGDGVWAWVQRDGTWWVNNAGLIAGDDGDLLVDTCATADRTAALLAAVAAVRPASRLRWAVNTHAHGDHTYGNSVLPADVTLIGHERMRETLAADAVIDGCPPFWSPVPDWGAVTRRLPDLTFDHALTVHRGATRVEVRHPGHAAHTTGDAVVWLPAQSVLFAGDLLFAGLTPLVFMGSLAGAAAVLDWIAAFDADVIVPGHGPVLSRADLAPQLDRHRRYYAFVRDAADRGLASGASPFETATRLDLGEFADWADAERIVLNLHRAYADSRGEELDVIAAFRDAVAWNGGPLRTIV
nr:MBL fold metallo-hydrolase [Microbacterium mangrovi]